MPSIQSLQYVPGSLEVTSNRLATGWGRLWQEMWWEAVGPLFPKAESARPGMGWRGGWPSRKACKRRLGGGCSWKFVLSVFPQLIPMIGFIGLGMGSAASYGQWCVGKCLIRGQMENKQASKTLEFPNVIWGYVKTAISIKDIFCHLSNISYIYAPMSSLKLTNRPQENIKILNI